MQTTQNNNAAAASASQRGAVVLQCTFQQNWYGRLGNNILSILNAALDAESSGLGFYIQGCSHDILHVQYYEYFSQAPEIKRILTPAEAFYINIYDYPQELDGLELILPFPAACCSRKRILTPLLEKFYTHPAAFKYNFSEVLVIHIRSGDIFDRTRPAEHRYAPPPLAYYQKIIDEHQQRRVVIVTEMDNMSPLVESLLNLYPKGMITLQAGTLEEDVAVVLGARHLVVSQGTFAYALALASQNLETMYMFNNIVHALDDRAFCNIKKVHYYAPRGGKYIERWEPTQIEYLMNFKATDLVEAVYEGSNNTCSVASSL